MYLIIPYVIYVIGGYSEGSTVNTLQSYDMTTQPWTTLLPMKEKRDSQPVCFQGDRIIVAGSNNEPNNLYTCEAFETKSKRFVLTHPFSAFQHCLSNSYSANVDLPSTCSWSTLARMTAKWYHFSLVCLPPNEGGLVAIGGFSSPPFIDVVESLDGMYMSMGIY